MHLGQECPDIALVIDAMDLLHSGRFDGFCLVSSDFDPRTCAFAKRSDLVEKAGGFEIDRSRGRGVYVRIKAKVLVKAKT